MSSYTEQYKDPRWQKKRLEIMDRDGFACCHCRDKQTTLNVHHSFYEKGRKIWDYEASYLVTLCEDCHGKFHLLIKTYPLRHRCLWIFVEHL